MMKRISTFRKKREDTPPAVAGDGVGEGEAPAGPKSPKASSKRFSFAQSKQHKSSEADEESDKPADANVFEQFAQLLHASQRPMPTQTGDGSYIEKEQHSTLLQDLKSLGFNDFDTVKEMLANKGKLQDDKTMIMERVIQVRHFMSLSFVHAASSARA